MTHPLFHSDRETPDKVLMMICEDNECPICTKSIKKMNEMRKEDYIELSKIVRKSSVYPSQYLPTTFLWGFKTSVELRT